MLVSIGTRYKNRIIGFKIVIGLTSQGIRFDTYKANMTLLKLNFYNLFSFFKSITFALANGMANNLSAACLLFATIFLLTLSKNHSTLFNFLQTCFAVVTFN